MQTYRNVLVPTDGSSGTDSAIEHAIGLASQYGATVHGLFVVDEEYVSEVGAHGRELSETIEEAGRAATEDLAERATGAGLEVVTDVRRGAPHRAIVEYVDDEGIDLVVMGTHGRTGIDRVLLGSVTERVVRHSPVPVMTVRLAAQSAPVRDADRAAEVARAALTDRTEGEAAVVDAYREASTWVVVAEADGDRYNVHIDAGTGRAIPAKVSPRADRA